MYPINLSYGVDKLTAIQIHCEFVVCYTVENNKNEDLEKLNKDTVSNSPDAKRML